MIKSLIIQKVLKYLISENKLTKEESESLSTENDLIEQGIIDSMSILELLVFMESEFSINLENVSVAASDMKTLNTIELFIIKNKGQIE
jgi:acyl carrier protein